MHDVFKQCLSDMQNVNLAMAEAVTGARVVHLATEAALQKRIANLEAALEDCLEYFKNEYDVVDGSYGEPAPNKEMQIGSMITEALYGPGVV